MTDPTNSLTPAEVFPPGEFLRDELEARGWSQTDLAEILGRPPRVINEVIAGKRAVTPETAKGLGEALGTGPEFWMNLESAWQLSRTADVSRNVIARRARLYEVAPMMKEMIRRHWIDGSPNIEVLEASVKAFFGMESLTTPVEIPHAARKPRAGTTGSVEPSDKELTPAQMAWLYRARWLARGHQVARFSPARFRDGLLALRQLFANAEDTRQVSRTLAEMGVRFVIVEPLAGTRIDGACMWLDQHSPIVALSLRYDRIDWFWFTLMHELGHVSAGDGYETSLDIDLVGEQASQAGKNPAELAADAFATENLVDQAELDNFIARIRPLYYKERIRGFAKRIGVHPGIVVGQLQHRGEISYAHNREMLEKVRGFVTRASITDGWGCDISLAV